jgi:hypothetical protein
VKAVPKAKRLKYHSWFENRKPMIMVKTSCVFLQYSEMERTLSKMHHCVRALGDRPCSTRALGRIYSQRHEGGHVDVWPDSGIRH